MKQRVITAIVSLVLFVPVVYYGSWILDLVVGILGVVALYELFKMKEIPFFSIQGVLSILALLALMFPQHGANLLPDQITQGNLFYFITLLLLICTVFFKNRFTFDDASVAVMGTLYIGYGFSFFLLTRQEGLDLLLFILFAVWATDIGAYLVGRQFGRHKLAPNISPNKTVEGSLGGVICAVIVATLYLNLFMPSSPLYWMLFLTVLISLAGQLGDLVESAFKRYYGVKDSGNILPGHGGILDRFDSLLFVLPILRLAALI